MIFDSHCHPQFPQYENDREEMIQRSLGEGVFMICVGTDLKTSKQGIELAQKYSGMWATVGVHPNDLDFEFKISNYELLLEKEKVVAIGEVGLDYYRTPEPEKQKKQKEVFEQFVDLAQRTDKPMVLHFRDSSKGSTGKVHKDALAMLPHDIRGVSHSFTGRLEEAKNYLNRDIYLGFNGIITFPFSHKVTEGRISGMYDEVVKYVPLDRMLLETDAPYLTPNLYRGHRNEPIYILEVAKKIASIKGIKLENVIEATFKNTNTLFGLIP